MSAAPLRESEGDRAGADRSWVAFEWATLRVVPRVHLEEFVNVGVILHARTAEFLDARVELRWERIAALDPAMDRGALQRHVDSWLEVCAGLESAGPVALLPPSERFHWLTAPRSAILQTSPVRPGRAHDPASELERLFAEQCGGSETNVSK